jgi:Flp pilus assembly protein TadD
MLAAAAILAALASADAQQPRSVPPSAARQRPTLPPPSPLAEAESAYEAGEAERATRAYARVLDADPNNTRALFRLGQLRRDRLDEAVHLFRRYTILVPRDAWGHMALGDALARAGRLSDALQAYAIAERLAPRERDVHVGRARLLVRAGHTDAAIESLERWTAIDARDAEAWSDLARQRRRAGRLREALTAAERASTLSPGREAAAAVTSLRRAIGGAVEARSTGSRDSDAITSQRHGASVTLPDVSRGRMLLHAGTKSVTGLGARASVRDLSLETRWRPLAALRFDLSGGAAWYGGELVSVDSSDPRSSGATTFGRVRLSWRPPSGAANIDLRASRVLLDASPTLARGGAVRDEVGAEMDLRLAGPLRARALGRVGAVRTDSQVNPRTLLGGALAAVGERGELAARVQRLRYAEPSASGYFAPRSADVAELAAYSEIETDAGASLTLDLGAGAQRVTRFGSVGTAWSPSLRGWAQGVLPIGQSVALGLELEAYDSRVAADAVTVSAGSWRYGSASVWLRLMLR